MRTVAGSVEEIITRSEIPLEAMRQGFLNFSAYAAQIQPEVEDLTWKSVKKSTIVVALTRLAGKLATIPPLQPVVVLQQLNIRRPVFDITFEKTDQSLQSVREILKTIQTPSPFFFTLTEGTSEITIIVSEALVGEVLAKFSAPPKAIYSNLVGLSASFSAEYLSQPNVIYSLIASLAGKRINLIEIVSTYTEITFIVEEKEMEAAIEILQSHFLQRRRSDTFSQ